MKTISRRTFLGTAVSAAGAVGLTGLNAGDAKALPLAPFGISLAGWSLHRTIGHEEGKIPLLDMPKMTRDEFDIDAIELVNNMLLEPQRGFAEFKPYLDELARNAAASNVRLILIMVDGQGAIGAEAEDERNNAIERHSNWIDICNYLGCDSMRMNWAGAPRGIEADIPALKAFIDRSVPGFRRLCEHGERRNVNVIIENHGGASSYPQAMVQLMRAVDHPRMGTLPDFGNFPRNEDGSYAIDVYEATDLLMSYAKAVSAKCYDFDDQTGLETKLDYPRLMHIVTKKHGYDGYVGIEYEGDRLSEPDGIKACKRLLERLRAE